MNLALLPLYAAVLPFLLWPIEILLPYPYVVEELAKTVLIYFIASKGLKLSKKITSTAIIGILFALSESVLYLLNIYSVGNLSTFFSRLLYTGLLHSTTSLIILASTIKDKRLIFLGTGVAIILHYFFNIYIAGV